MAFNVQSSDSRSGSASLSEINIIPFVDVVLVLLLIFMLTAPMMYRGIDVNLPKSSGSPAVVEERLVLTLTKDRAMYLNRELVAAATLESQLRTAFEHRTDRTLYLKADEGLAYGAVMETMDRIRRAGIDRLGMVTDPPAARER
jgi:biopolymer transport protein TolR